MNVITLSCCFTIGAALFIIRGGETKCPKVIN